LTESFDLPLSWDFSDTKSSLFLGDSPVITLQDCLVIIVFMRVTSPGLTVCHALLTLRLSLTTGVAKVLS